MYGAKFKSIVFFFFLCTMEKTMKKHQLRSQITNP